jgi:hypothetical protein
MKIMEITSPIYRGDGARILVDGILGENMKWEIFSKCEGKINKRKNKGRIKVK